MNPSNTSFSTVRQAVLRNDVALVQRLLKDNPTLVHNPDFDDKSNTSLHLAAQHGLFDVAVALISLGHDNMVVPEDDIYSNAGNNQGISINTDGQTPLHLAAASLRTTLVELLCQTFPKTIERQDNEGSTPLLIAAKSQTKGLPTSRSPAYTTAKSPIRPAEDTSTIEILLENGADITAKDRQGNTCLHNACAWGNLKAIRILLSAGADPGCANHAGWRPGYYSLTVQAEVYYKNLVADYEKRRAEELRIAEERRVKGTGYVRMISADDEEEDDDDDEETTKHDTTDNINRYRRADNDIGNDKSENKNNENDSDDDSEQYHNSRSRAGSSRSATTDGSIPF